jgi:hypothetical protein
MQTRPRRILGTIIFLAALLLALGLAIVAIWGDYEALSYFYTGAGYASFSGFSCPVMMSRSEVASVSARFDNPGNDEIQPYYEVDISGTAATRHLENQMPVPAHASRTVQWTVDANDIDIGSFVMVKMDVLPVGGYSTREATCGIVVFNLMGSSGDKVLWWTLAASLIGMVLGLGLREGKDQAIPGANMNLRNGMRAAGVAALLAMLTGFMGWWLIGVVFCAMTILLLAILLRIAVT